MELSLPAFLRRRLPSGSCGPRRHSTLTPATFLTGGLLCLLAAPLAAAQTPQLAVTTKPDPVEGGGAAGGGIVIVKAWMHPRAEEFEVTLVLGGTATKGTDYRIDAETFTFPPGTLSQTTNLRIIDDDVYDPGETITIHATSPGLRDSDQVTLTIADNDGGGGTIPSVSLSASPNPVAEGSPVTVTARLSSALSSAVTVPLTVTRGTAEAGDHGSLSSVTIHAGQTAGTGTIATSEDADTDDETFTVALGSLPSSVIRGSPSSVTVVINDDDGGGGNGGNGGNRPPTVTATCDPCTVAPGGEVRLEANASDPDDNALTYAWSAPGGTFAGPVDGASARWLAPSETGTVAVRVRVSDGRGGTASATVSVKIGGPPVFGSSSYAFELREGVPGRVVVGRVSAEDPEGGAVRYALAAGGRGRFEVGARDGAVAYTGPGEDHEAWPNRYELTVSARGPYGVEARARVTVVVTNVNEPPMAVADTARTAEDEGVAIDVLANDTDVEGDALRVESVTAPAHGTAWIASGGRVLYTPETDWHGTDRFAYMVADGNGGRATAEVVVVVEPVNDAPEAVADTARTAEDGEVLIDVLANDRDVEGDELRIESVTAPAHGTALIASGGGVLYAPEADWHGTDRFAYAVADGNGGRRTAEVVVVVEPVNDAPEAVADTTRTAEDEEVAIDVLANDTDVESDALRIESVTAPQHGTAEVVAQIAAGRRNGVLYAPEPDWHGTDRFVYTVTDGNGGTATAEVVVTVEPVNDAPEAVADTVHSPEDGEVLIDVLANDRDVEGDELHIESVTTPAHGAALIASGGGVLYTPEADWHGTDRFAYAVADGNGGRATAEVVVEVVSVNDAPEAVGAMPDLSLDEGGEVVVLDLTPYFEDRDGDTLTCNAASSDPAVVAVVVAGSMLRVTPVGYGETSVEVTATDPGGLDARQTFRVGTSDRMVRTVLDETLAAMGRAHLASARMTLGRRVGPGGGAEASSMLTVMGRRVPLGREAARAAAGRLLEGWALSRLLRGGGLVEAGQAFESRAVKWAATAGSDGPRDLADMAAALDVAGLGGFRNSNGPGGGTEWVFVFGEQSGTARLGGAWRFWGQGDIQTFVGEPSAERNYEGDLRTGYVGLDRSLGGRLLAGVAVARSSGVGDWRAGFAGGRLETSLTAVHPYVRWSDGTTSLWAMGGGGWGSVRNTRGPRATPWDLAPPKTSRVVGTSGLDLRLGLLEARRRFAEWFALRADAAWARLATAAGTETVDGRGASVDQQRLGIELSPSLRLGGLALEPFGEATARRDGGAGQTGSGVEVSGGLRVVGGPVRIDAHGRILVLHSADGYEERGLGLTVSVGSPSSAEGLLLSISPRWGGPATATGALWREALPGRPAPGYGPDAGAWSLDAAARYGLRLPGGRLLEWFGSLVRSGQGWGLTIGGGFGLTAGEAITMAGPAR